MLDSVCELFGETICDVFAVLLLNVMDVFSVHMFCLCFCISEVISSFKSLRAGSHVFALLMLFLWVILHTMWSGECLQLLCILPFSMLCLSAISMMLIKIMLAVCMLVGMSEAYSVSSVICAQSAFFLLVGSVVVCSHVVC